jgi:hypothetical protein
MEPRLFIAGIFVLSQLLLPAAADGVAYRWVDADGVTHFSDTPPAADNAVSGSVESLNLVQDHSAPVDPATDYYSIINQWKRMRAERIESEKLALQQEKLRLQRSREERIEKETAATQYSSGDEPVVVFGVARPFIYGRRPFPAGYPAFYPGFPRHNLYHQRHGARRTAPSHHHFGNRYTGTVSAGQTKFKCC